MLAGLKNRWRNLMNVYAQNKVMGYWQSKRYDKMADVLKTPQSYQSIKISDFSFIFFLINEKDREAISTLLNKLPYKSEILNDQNNPMSMTPICYAFLDGDTQTVEILQKNGGDLKKPNSSLQNILHLSAIYKQQNAFKNAVNLNIDINLRDEFGNTPFHYAARTGSVEMTSVMISAKAKKLQNKIHQYPVHMAIESGSLQTFDLLKIDALGTYPKYHPIHSASRCGNVKMAETILKLKPASLNFKDQKGLTPLHHAVMQKCERHRIQDSSMVVFLLKQPGILVNEADQFGNTPLHLSMMNSNQQLSKLLLENNADLEVQNSDNLSPADYGITSNSRQMHSLLLTWREKSKKIQEWSKGRM